MSQRPSLQFVLALQSLTTFEAVLERLHRAELIEVSRDDELHTVKRLIRPSRCLHQAI